MSIEFKPLIRKPEYYIITAAIIFRIVLGMNLGIWLECGAHDGGFFIAAANPSGDFILSPQFSLIKNLSYGLFLEFVNLTGLSYSLILSLIWILTAFSARKVFKYISSNGIFLTFVFLFTLFTPAAFDHYIGTRLYRNSIIAPFVLLVFLLMIWIYFSIMAKTDVKIKNLIILNTALGFLFSFTYYIKEDGIWLLGCLIGFIAVNVIILTARILKNRKDRTRADKSKLLGTLISIFLPVLIFTLITQGYKSENYGKYEIYETNSRTEGELGRFVELVYEVDSPNRNQNVWAPADAIDKTYEVSETFQKYPQIIENIRNTDWVEEDIYKNPIQGDFLTWILRDAVYNAGLWTGDGDVNAIFAQINSEIEDAFESGELEKDGRFKPLASTGGYTKEEILSLMDIVKEEFNIQINIKNYKPGGIAFYDNRYPEAYTSQMYAIAEDITNQNFALSTQADRNLKNSELESVNSIVHLIFEIYSIVNPVLITLAIIGVLATVIYLIAVRCKKLKHSNQSLGSVIFLTLIFMLVSLAYAFGIAWFDSFINTDGINFEVLKFYSVGLVPMLTIIEMFGAYFLSIFIKNLHSAAKQ